MYSLSTIQKMIATAALIASFSIAAETAEEDKSVDTLAEAASELDSINPLATDAMVSEQIAIEEMAYNELNTEEFDTEEFAAEELVVDEYATTELVTEVLTDEELLAEEFANAELVAEGLPAEDVVSEEIANAELVAEGLPAEDVVSEEFANEELVAEGLPAEEVVSDRMLDEVKTTEVLANELTTTKTNSSGMHTQKCPKHFYQVKLPNNGKLCQVFAAELPASMIFYVPQLPEEVIAFYQQDTNVFSTTRYVKDRVLLQTEDKNTTVIISTDGAGTQVDVLVKSSNS